MRLRGRRLVLFVDLDRFIAFRSDHPEGAAVELDIENASLAGEGTWLHLCFNLLEIVSALPVEELE